MPVDRGEWYACAGECAPSSSSWASAPHPQQARQPSSPLLSGHRPSSPPRAPELRQQAGRPGKRCVSVACIWVCARALVLGEFLCAFRSSTGRDGRLALHVRICSCVCS